MTNLSLSSFKREFKKNYNDTPANYIRNKKLEKSAELLALSEERITDVAFDCGFNSTQYFATVFKKWTGKSPSAHKNEKVK